MTKTMKTFERTRNVFKERAHTTSSGVSQSILRAVPPARRIKPHRHPEYLKPVWPNDGNYDEQFGDWISDADDSSVTTISPEKFAIIEQVYRDSEYRYACEEITRGDALSDELFHETVMTLIGYDDDKIVGLHTRGELRWFITRIMMTMWRCKSSPFYRAYRKKTESVYDDMTVPDEIYDIARDSFHQHALEATDRIIQEKLNSGNREDWYEATLWKLYISAGSFRKAEAISKVPYKSIANTVRRMRLIITERIDLEAGRKINKQKNKGPKGLNRKKSK
jgi:hypothetical protein